ncbi:MAG: hypothetical protein ACKO4V_03660 [Planctomycetota bacterium]
MDSGANIRDTKAILDAKALIVKAARSMASVVEESQADSERFGLWLSGEAQADWERQVRLRTTRLNEARSELMRKQMQPTADGRPPSTVDERKAVSRAEAALALAEDRLRRTRRWVMEYQRVLANFRAGMGSLGTFVDQIAPAAVAALNRMAESVDAYLAAQTSPLVDTPTTDIPSADSSISMRRTGTDHAGTEGASS